MAIAMSDRPQIMKRGLLLPDDAPDSYLLVLGFGPRWLFFDPTSSSSSSGCSNASVIHVSTYLRLSDPISPKAIQDHNPAWQWILYRWMPPPDSPAPFTPPFSDGQDVKVLLALSSPRLYLGAKPSGELFLVEAPTTMTLWTLKVPSGARPNEMCLLSQHGSWLASSLSSLIAVKDPSPSGSGSLNRDTHIIHAHKIPNHVLHPESLGPLSESALVKHNNRPNQPPPRGPPPPPTLIDNAIALFFQQSKRALCKRSPRSKWNKGIGGVVCMTKTKSSAAELFHAHREPMEFYLGKTTRKTLDKQTDEMVAFFHLYFAEPSFTTRANPGLNRTADGLNILSAKGPNWRIVNDTLTLSSGLRVPPRDPNSIVNGWECGRPIDVARADGRLVLIVSADTGTYLAMNKDGSLLDLDHATGDESTCQSLWMYRRLPTSPLALALMNTYTGMFLTLDKKRSLVHGVNVNPVPKLAKSKNKNKKMPQAPPIPEFACLTAQQALRMYIPASLPQALNALHARPPPGRMMILSVALICTSLVSATAAIANVLIRAKPAAPPGPPVEHHALNSTNAAHESQGVQNDCDVSNGSLDPVVHASEFQKQGDVNVGIPLIHFDNKSRLAVQSDNAPMTHLNLHGYELPKDELQFLSELPDYQLNESVAMDNNAWDSQTMQYPEHDATDFMLDPCPFYELAL